MRRKVRRSMREGILGGGNRERGVDEMKER